MKKKPINVFDVCAAYGKAANNHPALKKQNTAQLTEAQILLRGHLRELGFQHPVYEFQFCKERKFKADLACYGPSNDLWLFECDGGQWSGGHMRGKKLEDQYEKDRLAQALGHKIFRFTNRQITNGDAKLWISKHLLGLDSK